jgi:hypothetical protein
MSLEQYYNKKTSTLTLPYYFNEELYVLPLNIKVIIFEQDYNKYEYSKFNKSINNLPNSITHLTLGFEFNQPVGHQGCEDINCHRNLANSITHLTFGTKFNQPVNNLPNSITHLTFAENSLFNQPVNNLPNSITHLTFGNKFNQPVDHLPNSITHLTFSYYSSYFNQPVDNLPNSITNLTFGHKFNQSIDNLPNSITHLTFEYCFDKALDNLPLFLQQIKFNSINNERILSKIKKVPFGCKILNKNDQEIFLQ